MANQTNNSVSHVDCELHLIAYRSTIGKNNHEAMAITIMPYFLDYAGVL